MGKQAGRCVGSIAKTKCLPARLDGPTASEGRLEMGGAGACLRWGSRGVVQQPGAEGEGVWVGKWSTTLNLTSSDPPLLASSSVLSPPPRLPALLTMSTPQGVVSCRGWADGKSKDIPRQFLVLSLNESDSSNESWKVIYIFSAAVCVGLFIILRSKEPQSDGDGAVT